MANPEVPYAEAALAAVKDQSLSPQAVADEVVEQCHQCVTTAATWSGDDMDTMDGVTAGLYPFLWYFWGVFLSIAQADASMHDRLAKILAALKAKGSQGCDGWILWGSPATWTDLPFFGIASREAMNGPDLVCEGHGLLDPLTPRLKGVLCGDVPGDDPVERKFARSRQEWLNMNTFLAKLWALDIVDEHFFGISTMRMNLEPLSVKGTRGPSTGDERTETGDPQELEIEVAAIWVKIAGAKMHACREILGPKGNPSWEANRGAPGASGGTWSGVDGFHPDRWAHWKQILTEVAQGNWRKNVTDAAQAAVEAMEECERGA